jgi:hypothetical protein
MKRFTSFLVPLFVASCGPETSAGGPSSNPMLPEQTVLGGGSASSAGGTSGGLGGGAAGGGSVGTQFAYPLWQREDIQAASPRHTEVYGLEAFRGRTVVVVLLEGFCTFCRSNVVVAEQLQTTLRAEGRDVEVVVLSDANAADFASRTRLRLFRDGEAGRPAWREMRPTPSKHDTFVFAPSGERVYFWQGSYTGDAARWTTDVGQAVRAVAPVQ